MKLKDYNLEPIDIGNWCNYQSYVDKEQIALQRNNLIFTGLYNGEYEVKFIYTKKIDQLLKRIDDFRQDKENENTETILEDEIYYTTKIEGAKTTRKRTSEIHRGTVIVTKDSSYDDKMVKNAFNAVKLLNIIGSKEINTDILVKVWNVLVEGVCDNESIRGDVYRTGDVEVGSHEGVPFQDVPKLMNQWCFFYNSTMLDEKPFLKTMLLHYMFETIHPFCDGNGRMGRLLINNYLISRGIETARAVSISTEIGKNRSKYDAAFVDAENNLYQDCTPFLEYMLEMTMASYYNAREVQREADKQKQDDGGHNGDDPR